MVKPALNAQGTPPGQFVALQGIKVLKETILGCGQ